MGIEKKCDDKHEDCILHVNKSVKTEHIAKITSVQMMFLSIQFPFVLFATDFTSKFFSFPQI
jgi:hypothetical protein